MRKFVPILTVVLIACVSAVLGQPGTPLPPGTPVLGTPSAAPGILVNPLTYPIAVLPDGTELPSLSGVGGFAANSDVVIRSGPGTQYNSIGGLRQGRWIDITGTNGFDVNRNCSPDFARDLDMWVEVRFRGITGWVARCVLQIRGDLSRLPIRAVPPPGVAPSLTPVPGQVLIATPRAQPTAVPTTFFVVPTPAGGIVPTQTPIIFPGS